MAWRGLHIALPSRLSLADGQIVVQQEDGDARLPLEDIAWIVLDTHSSTLSGALLSACTQAGIALIVTDETHTPSGVMLPFHRHHRQADIAQLQIAASAPVKKRLWQAIIQSKIANQASAMESVGAKDFAPLRAMSSRVGSGDPDNLEAQAARHYWGRFWPQFRREDEGDRRNKMLNYGYAVVRSAVARALVASGLLPAFGLKHASATNAFNLADDLVEPFRPFVDILAWRTAGNGPARRDTLTLEDRRIMAGVLLAECRLAGETLTLLTATERAAASLVRSLEAKSPALLQLPDLLP